MTGLEVAVGAAGTFRLTWLVVYDTITEPARRRLERNADKARAAERTSRRRKLAAAVWPWIHTLATCPWCVSVWIGAAVAAYLDAGGPLVVLAALSFSAAAGLAANLGRALAAVAGPD